MIKAKCTVNGQTISESGTSGIDVLGGSTITVALVNTADVLDWSIVATQADDKIQADGYLDAVNNSKVQNAFSATFVMPAKYSSGRGSAIQFTSTINSGKENEAVYTFGVFVRNDNGTRLFFGGESNESNATVGNAADLNALVISTGTSGSAGGDLSGTYPNPSVVKLRGTSLNASVGTVSAAQDGYGLTWNNASSSWTPAKVSALPGGSSTQVQFNDSSSFGGDAGLTYDKATDFLSVVGGLKLGSAPAATGDLRASSGFAVKYAVSAVDHSLIQGTSGAQVVIGGYASANDCLGIINRVSSGSSIYNQINGANYLTVTETGTTISPVLNLGSTPATVGDIRGTTQLALTYRASGADVPLIKGSGSQVIIGGNDTANDCSAVIMRASISGGAFYHQIVGVDYLTVTSTATTVSPALAVGSTTATVGQIRLPGGSKNQIWARNNANSANFAMLDTSAADELFVGTSNAYANQCSIVRIYGASWTYLGAGSTTQLGASSSGVYVASNLNLGFLNTASTGLIRSPGGSVSILSSRNNANTADIAIVNQDTSNNLYFGQSSSAANQCVAAKIGASGSVTMQIGSTTVLSVDSSSQITLKSTNVIENGNTKGTNTTRQANVQTTDATVTTVDSGTIPNGVSIVDVVVTAVKSDYTNGATYKRSMTFRNNAGTVSAISTVTDAGTKEDNSAWDCTIDNITTTWRVRVTGVAATTIQWYSVTSVKSVVP